MAERAYLRDTYQWVQHARAALGSGASPSARVYAATTLTRSASGLSVSLKTHLCDRGQRSLTLLAVAKRLSPRRRFEHKATITRVSFEPAFLLLSSTIFHPQGGGQPSDTGQITLAGGASTFCVSMCKVDRDLDDIVHEVWIPGRGGQGPAR